jgi:hypothetical protein
MAYGNGIGGGYGGGSPGSNLTGPTDQNGGTTTAEGESIPYTTAATDFIRASRLKDVLKLQEIDYAATDFLSLKNSLINYVRSVYPQDFQNFNESDLAMMLIELVSYMGAVMSLKADMLANENFLPTAKSRPSVTKLLSLIGYNMRGPISSAANAELTLDIPLTGRMLQIPAENRTTTITSPEDNMPLSFTLYKVRNGVLVPTTAESSLNLYKGETSDGSRTWNNLIFVEGSLTVQRGVFDNSPGTKIIPLTQTPVAEKSVEVFVDTGVVGVSGAYTQVDNLFQSSGSDSRIFEVRTVGEGGGIVIFGDGENGISPPPNAGYTISYRIGGGTRGNVLSETLNVLVAGVDDTGNNYEGNAFNPSPATGGANAQTAEEAKEIAPLSFKRQDRVVSLEDYESFCNNFVGPFGKVAKCVAATRKAYCSANIIDLYILGIAGPLQLQKSSLSYKNALLAAIKPKKMITDEVVVNDGYIATLDLVLSIRLEERMKSREQEVELKVNEFVLEYFNVANRNFGEPFHPQDLIRDLYQLREVRFATVDNLEGSVNIDFNAIIQLNNLVINTIYV